MRVTWPRPSYCDILHSLWSELGWTNTITAHSSVIIRLEMELQIQMTFGMADYSENCQNSLFRMSDHLLSSYKLLSWTELTVSCWYQYLYQTTSSLCSYYRSAVCSLANCCRIYMTYYCAQSESQYAISSLLQCTDCSGDCCIEEGDMTTRNRYRRGTRRVWKVKFYILYCNQATWTGANLLSDVKCFIVRTLEYISQLPVTK